VVDDRQDPVISSFITLGHGNEVRCPSFKRGNHRERDLQSRFLCIMGSLVDLARGASFNVIFYILISSRPPAASSEELQGGVSAAMAHVVVKAFKEGVTVGERYKWRSFLEPRPAQIDQGIGRGVVLKQLVSVSGPGDHALRNKVRNGSAVPEVRYD
jgi:hypothetical protein